MWKRILLAGAVILLAIQFIRPTRNLSTQAPGADDFIVRFNPPANVSSALRRACYDCHSDSTRYPWYADIQPVAWWLASHIDEGKEHLNLSRFGTYTPRVQARKLNRISDEMVNREMPLWSYTLIHADARLTDAEVNEVSDWIDALHDKLAPAQPGK
jgi:hypothetical protein